MQFGFMLSPAITMSEKSLKLSGSACDSYYSLNLLNVGHGEGSVDLYLADPTSSIPSHCAVIVLFKMPHAHAQIARTS